MAEGVFAVMQDNGKGVAWCTGNGGPLADLLAGADPRDLPLPPVTPLRPIPLHPLRSVYAAAGSLWLRARDALMPHPVYGWMCWASIVDPGLDGGSNQASRSTGRVVFCAMSTMT